MLSAGNYSNFRAWAATSPPDLQGRALTATHTSTLAPAWLPGTHSQPGSSSGLHGTFPGCWMTDRGNLKSWGKQTASCKSRSSTVQETESYKSYYSTPLLLRGGQPGSPNLTVTSLVLDGVKRWVFTSKYTPFSLCPTSTRISQHLSQI